MNTEEVIDITSVALKMIVEQKRFSTTELRNNLEGSVAKQDLEMVLQYLQEAGWIEQTTGEIPTWGPGPASKRYLSFDSIDKQPFRVLPGEVPDDESIR